jgi:hypothetical protein
MKLEAARLNRETIESEQREVEQLQAEKTAKLRALRLAKEAAQGEVSDDIAIESEKPARDWPWRFPQVHRR